MESIIGRKAEIQQLNDLADSPRAEFVALYGRRRVGKTFLVNSLFEDRFSFNMSGVIEGTLDAQFMAFADAMEESGFKVDEKPKDWMSAFILLKKSLKTIVDSGEKCIIFIDELPAMDAGGSNVAGALGYFWNSWASKHDNVLLIVCGSATSWMISNVIDSKGGLHDRLTLEMHIHPFSLAETEQYFVSHGFLWNRWMVMQSYMLFGGIPYYLSLLKGTDSLVQNVDRLFFGRDTLMRREFRRLFNTLYKRPDRYMEIVKMLYKYKSGLTRTELANLLKCQNNGHLGNALEDLVYCDLVRKNVVREKSIKKKDAIYQLCDFFSIFHLTFIARAELEPDYWSHHINTPEVNTWMGLAFERICMAHIPQIKKALRIDGISTVCYSWRSKTSSKTAQIDMIIQRADSIVNICEIKFSQDAYRLDKEEYEKIVNRKNIFLEETEINHTPWITVITTMGLAKGVYSGMIQKQLTLDDLFTE